MTQNKETKFFDIPHLAKQFVEVSRDLEIILGSDLTDSKYAEMLYAVLTPESFELSMTAVEPELIRYSFRLMLENMDADSANTFFCTVKIWSVLFISRIAIKNITRSD